MERQGEYLSPEGVLAALAQDDGIALNKHMRCLRDRVLEQWLFDTYRDQDFSSWDRYRTWLLAEGLVLHGYRLY